MKLDLSVNEVPTRRLYACVGQEMMFYASCLLKPENLSKIENQSESSLEEYNTSW
jgi:hypothetical protein